jgi:hypothetical protein
MKRRYEVDHLVDENKRLIAKLREFQSPIERREKLKSLIKPDAERKSHSHD